MGLKNFIAFFDMAPVSYTPTINYRRSYKSCCCGCCSICCWCFLIPYIFLLFFSVFTYLNININSQLSYTSAVASNTQNMNLSFDVVLIFNNGSTIVLTNENHLENGLNFTFMFKCFDKPEFEQFSMDYKNKKFYIPFQQCTSQKTNCLFDCSVLLANSQYYQVFLEKCNQTMKKCIPFQDDLVEIFINVSGTYQYSDLASYSMSREDFEYDLQKDQFSDLHYLILSQGQLKNRQIFLSYLDGVILQCYMSVFPPILGLMFQLFGIDSSINFYNDWYFDRTIKKSLDDESKLISFSFQGGNKMKNYHIHSDTIDGIFGNIFGILAVFTILAHTLSCGFKHWFIQIEIAKTLNEDNKDQEKHIMKPSFLNYLRYTFSCGKCSKGAKETQQKIEEAEKSLDLMEMRRNINMLNEITLELKRQNEKLKSIVHQKIQFKVEVPKEKEVEVPNNEIKSEEQFLEEKYQFQNSQSLKEQLL